MLPGEQHLAIFGDLVLPLLGGQQVRRIDVLEPDEHTRHAGAPRLLDEVRNLVAERVDLDDQPDVDLVLLADPDQPVEDVFPVLVAGEIVVGDEEAADAVGPVLLDQLLDVVGRAAARLAALHIDDGAERALERAAAAGVEARVIVEHALHGVAREIGRRCQFDRRQVVHEIVDRLERAGRRVLEHLVDAAFGLAREQAAAEVERDLQIGLGARQHRQQPGDMKAADHNRNARRPQRPRDIERARILVGLHADKPDHAEAVVAPDQVDDLFGLDAGVGLVDRGQINVDVGAEHTAGGRFRCQRIDAGERVRRDRRAAPLHHIAIVVVV